MRGFLDPEISATGVLEQKISERITRAIDEAVFPACVAGCLTPDEGKTVLAFGRQTYESGSAAVSEDSIFDVASITKAVPVSSLCLLLVDRKKLALSDRVISYIPELTFSGREDVLIRHLLTQTLDFNFRMSLLKDMAPQDILKEIFSRELASSPGSTFNYCNATSILLGIVVERVFGECLSVVADREFFAPLSMARTSFFPESFTRSDIIPTENDPWRSRIVRGEVHDESAFVLRKIMVAGSAGLFTTVPDLLVFCEMLLNSGVWKGTRYFSDALIDSMQANQTASLGVSTGLGWELNQKRYMGRFCSEKTIGKTGFTGGACIVDIPMKKALVVLSNYTFPSRKPDARAIDAVRSDIADIVFFGS
jgi:CubicO group peptidase (beta-lactamase class C family)